MIKKVKKLYKKYDEIINYLIVGVLTTIVSLIIYYGYYFKSSKRHPITNC